MYEWVDVCDECDQSEAEQCVKVDTVFGLRAGDQGDVGLAATITMRAAPDGCASGAARTAAVQKFLVAKWCTAGETHDGAGFHTFWHTRCSEGRVAGNEVGLMN